ncbi:MAG: hypothetical protein JJU26_08910 [Oceanicaulis sp.]|uniref:hypothetical protein n=1 Tax=Glycocaulis sp. TaxID=1969725 RepID=UPI0025B91FE5|nr:hypothetical protein [Glycocaulis sp.]MCC5981822.1 hypothetical protein [Oceanicaulis sp.]MCH8521227.1 hypothetical protein [Glycocaulis sp.]
MHPAIKGMSIVLAIAGLASWGFAAYRTFEGTPFQDNLALMISGLVCFTMVVVLNAVNGKKKG